MRILRLEGSTKMTEYMNKSPNELEQLFSTVKKLQSDIELLFAKKEQKKQALLNACNAKKNNIEHNVGSTLEDSKQNLEIHRKRFQAAIRASESAKAQMIQAEKMFKEASQNFKRSSFECEKQEKETIKKISKEFSNQIKVKQKELRILEHRIKAVTQNL